MKTTFCCLLLAVFSSLSLAHNKVVVIPMVGDDAVPIKNIITVGLKNADFTNPADALNSITEASAFEPYLVFIGPGTYTLGPNELVVKPNVQLVGSGTGVTILEGGFGNSDVELSAVVTLDGFVDNRSALRDLTIIQYGASSDTSSGIYVEGWSVIDNIEVDVRSTGATNYGIYADSAVLEIRDSYVDVENASLVNIGISINGGSYDMDDIKIGVVDGIFTAAVYSIQSNLDLNKIDATSSQGATTNALWGLYTTSNSITNVDFSAFNVINSSGGIANLGGCFVDSSSTGYIYFSTIAHGCVSAGQLFCAFAKGTRETELLADCQSPP